MQSRAATRLLLEAALVEPGMRILDLASGSGEPVVSLAEWLTGQGWAVTRHASQKGYRVLQVTAGSTPGGAEPAD